MDGATRDAYFRKRPDGIWRGRLHAQLVRCEKAPAWRAGGAFRATSLCVSFPGLKVWAVIFSPFGRSETSKVNANSKLSPAK